MRTWYEIKNSAETPNQTEVLLYDEIGGFGISAARFLAELQQISKENRLLLRIHSPGGSILDGNAIFTALRNWPGGVTTHIDGLAASMASVVAVAGKPVQMAGNAILMIHRASAGAQGSADDLRKMADTVEKVESTIINAYVGKTGLSKKRITQMMDAETWMTATEAEELGFVDEITGELNMAAHFDLSGFKNVPLTQLAAAMAKPNQLLAEADARINELETAHATAVAEKDQKITELETKVTELTATAESQKTAATLALDGFAIQVEKLETEKTALGSKVTQLEKDAKSSDERAREIAARNGATLPAKALNVGNKTTTGSDKEMSRADFNALTPADRLAFAKKGGRLTDE